MVATAPDAASIDARFARALEQRGVSYDVVASAAAEAVDAQPAAGLAEGEMQFAIRAGILADAFTPEARQEAAVGRVIRAVADTARLSPRMTTNEVAKLLRRDPANVRRMHLNGDLVAAGQAERQTTYPAWQFTAGDRVLPHLRRVIAAFPSDFSARDIEVVMTSPMEELRGKSPKEWLEADGSAPTLIALIEELSLT